MINDVRLTVAANSTKIPYVRFTVAASSRMIPDVRFTVAASGTMISKSHIVCVYVCVGHIYTNPYVPACANLRYHKYTNKQRDRNAEGEIGRELGKGGRKRGR